MDDPRAVYKEHLLALKPLFKTIYHNSGQSWWRIPDGEDHTCDMGYVFDFLRDLYNWIGEDMQDVF